MRAADVERAFSSLEEAEPTTGESSSLVVVRCEGTPMLDQYAGPSRHWRTVTPVALPEVAGRRRIDPAHRHEEAKGARNVSRRSHAQLLPFSKPCGTRTSAPGR